MNMNGRTWRLTEEELNANKRRDLLNLLMNYKDASSYQDLLHFLGFEFVGSPVQNMSILEPYTVCAPAQEDVDLMYYEYLCIHPATGLAVICYLLSQGAGSFGFELTQENWDAHVERLKKEAYANEVMRTSVSNHQATEMQEQVANTTVATTKELTSFDVLAELGKHHVFLEGLVSAFDNEKACLTEALQANRKVIQLFEHINEVYRTSAANLDSYEGE